LRRPPCKVSSSRSDIDSRSTPPTRSFARGPLQPTQKDLGSTGIGNSAFAQTAFDLRITGRFTLSARGRDTNRVDGDIVCNGGEPARGLKTGTSSDWDGLDDDVDATIGGNYLGSGD
jgi:hypothetical protein